MPSKTTLYRHLSSNYTKFFFSSNCDIEVTLKNNLDKILSNVDRAFFSLKLDGVAIKDVKRWCSGNNEFTGLCYNHRTNLSNFCFHNLSNLEELKAALQNDLVHVCKELLVITIMNISSEKQYLEMPKVVALIPICLKSNDDFMPQAYKFIDNY